MEVLLRSPSLAPVEGEAPTRPGPIAYVAVPLLYLLGSAIGSRLTMTYDAVSVLWPPNAILLAAFVRYRGARWWVFAALAMLAEIAGDVATFGAWDALAFGVANVTEATVAWLFLQAWGFDPRFRHVTDVGRFVLAGPLVGGLVGAVLGATWVVGVSRPGSPFADALQVWWFGDGLGLLIFAPLYLSWWMREARDVPMWSARRSLDVVMTLGGVATLLLVLGTGGALVPTLKLRPLLLLPFVAYMAVRLPFRWVCVVVTALSLVLVGATVSGYPPYGEAPPPVAVVWTQELVGVLSVLALGLSSLLGSVRRADEALREANVELRRRAAALERINLDLSRIAYAASHELQTPLRSISGFSQLLQSEFGDKLGPTGDDFVRRVTKSTRQLEALLRDLGTVADVDMRAAPFGSVSMEAVFDDAVRALAEDIRVTGAVVTRDALPVVRGDRAQLTGVLTELVRNALKFRRVNPPHVHVSARLHADEHVFSVRDDGIGIPPEHHERLFDLFYRIHGRVPGTGVGLPYCARVIHRHGGRIWFESTPDSGSTFHFSIPASEGMAA